MDDNPGMMPMSVTEIAQSVYGSLVLPQGMVVDDGLIATSAVSDSRQVRFGTVFVAIAGERVDGHDFVRDAAGQGAVAAIVDHRIEDVPIAQMVVPDTVAALGALARHNIVRRREQTSPFSIVGITGSVGKTTTKDLLRALLGSIGATVAPVGSFNNDIGLPLTALRVNAGTRFLVAEMGANHVGEIAKLVAIAPPDVAVVLKVGVAHLGEFGSVERIAQAKSEIVQGLVPDGVAVLNADDLRVAAMAEMAPGKVLWFGLQQGHDLADMTTAYGTGTDALDRPMFQLCGADGERATVHLGISGEHNVMNALAASAVAGHFGLTPGTISGILRHVRRISPHRMAVSTVSVAGVRFTLIDDSYNANPDSTKAGISGLIRWGSDKRPRPYRVAVLGAMLELGRDEDVLHRAVGAYAARFGVDALIAVGSDGDDHVDSLARSLAQGATEELDAVQGERATAISVHLVHTTAEADRMVRAIAIGHPDTVVLLKGSHVSGLSALAQRWNADGAQCGDAGYADGRDDDNQPGHGDDLGDE